MEGQALELRIDVGVEPDADALELDEETIELRREFLELDVDAVERPAAGPPPEGARAVEVALLGTLLVKVGQAAVGPLVDAIAAWMSRRDSRSVKLTLGDDSIEATDLSDEDQRRLLEAFLARHTAAG